MLIIESQADINVRRDVMKLVNQVLYHTKGKSFPRAETGTVELTGFSPAGDGKEETAKFDYKVITLGADLELPKLKLQYSELRVGVVYVDPRILIVPYFGEFQLTGPFKLPTVLAIYHHVPEGFKFIQPPSAPRLDRVIKLSREIGYGHNWDSIDDVDFHVIFTELADLLVHEFTHAIDYLSKARKGWQLKTRTFKPGKEPTEKRPSKLSRERQLDREAYLKNEAELNAHLFQFFFGLVLKFKKKYKKQTKENADLFAPRFQDLWELFLDEVPEYHFDFLDEKFLMKKYLKRLHSMWEAYYNKLPDR